jgi:hypothetical protein
MTGDERGRVFEKFVRVAPPEPVFLTKPPSATLSITKPVADPNADKLIGFNLYSLWHSVSNLLQFIPVLPEDPFEYSVPSSFHRLDTVFYIKPVYERGVDTFEGDPSPTFQYPEFAESIGENFMGGENFSIFNSTTFPPLKFFSPETVSENFTGGEGVAVFEIVGYENIVAKSDADPDTASENFTGGEDIGVVLIGGFGIIGVG